MVLVIHVSSRGLKSPETTFEVVQRFQTPTGNASTQGIMCIYVGNDEKIVYYILVVPLQSQKHHSTKNKQSIKRRI